MAAFPEVVAVTLVVGDDAEGEGVGESPHTLLTLQLHPPLIPTLYFVAASRGSYVVFMVFADLR